MQTFAHIISTALEKFIFVSGDYVVSAKILIKWN